MSRRANSVEKMQVFWAWSSLRMSAWTVPRTLLKGLGFQRGVRRSRPALRRPCIPAAATPVRHCLQEARRGRRGGESRSSHLAFRTISTSASKALLTDVLFAALVDGGVQEEPQHDWSGPIDRHGHARVGGTQVKPTVQLLRVVETADAHPELPTLP